MRALVQHPSMANLPLLIYCLSLLCSNILDFRLQSFTLVQAPTMDEDYGESLQDLPEQAKRFRVSHLGHSKQNIN